MRRLSFIFTPHKHFLFLFLEDIANPLVHWLCVFFLQPRYRKQSGSDFFLTAAEKVTRCLDRCLLLPWSTEDPGAETGSNSIPLESTVGVSVLFPVCQRHFAPPLQGWRLMCPRSVLPRGVWSLSGLRSSL